MSITFRMRCLSPSVIECSAIQTHNITYLRFAVHSNFKTVALSTIQAEIVWGVYADVNEALKISSTHQSPWRANVCRASQASVFTDASFAILQAKCRRHEGLSVQRRRLPPSRHHQRRKARKNAEVSTKIDSCCFLCSSTTSMTCQTWWRETGRL